MHLIIFFHTVKPSRVLLVTSVNAVERKLFVFNCFRFFSQGIHAQIFPAEQTETEVLHLLT